MTNSMAKQFSQYCVANVNNIADVVMARKASPSKNFHEAKGMEEGPDFFSCSTPMGMSVEEAAVWLEIDELKFGEEDYKSVGITRAEMVAWLCECRNASFHDAEGYAYDNC